MKKTEITILSHLRQDGRIALTELSRKTKLPVSTIYDRLRHGIKEKIIKPSALINFEKLGFATRAQIVLAAENTERDKLFEYLNAHPNVNSLYRINNGWNVLMECVFKNMHSLENFVEQIESTFRIKQKEIHYILEEIKREGCLAKPEQARELLSNI
jgi:Lrp/AsnC family transcriptional regulator for asnA, asnC and gidA